MRSQALYEASSTMASPTTTSLSDEVTPAKDEATISIAARDDFETYRRNFLSRFTAEDDKRIMRKVDSRFLLLMGFMYLIKQIDYTNAASIKVLQVGTDRNVLTELGMTANDYNWLTSFYFVRAPARLSRCFPSNADLSSRSATASLKYPATWCSSASHLASGKRESSAPGASSSRAMPRHKTRKACGLCDSCSGL